MGLGLAIAVIPAILWGCTPLWTHICGGTAFQQIVGSTYGALIIGIGVYLLERPSLTWWGSLWCFLAGVGWCIGQLTTYVAYMRVSVSTTAPIMSGVPLVTVNLVGVLFFGSWASVTAKIVGAIATILIIIGVIFTTKSGTGGNKNSNVPNLSRKAYIKNIIILILGVGIGFTAEGSLPRIAGASGFATYPPQSVGMIAAAIVFSLCAKKYRTKKTFFGVNTFKNLLTGASSGLGSFAYLIAMMMVGVSTGYTLSRMSVAVSVLIGLVFLHEHKHGKALANVLIGLVLVVIGGAMTGFIGG